MSKIKSFRGQMASSTQEIIHLHTNDGSVGYRIKKLEAIQKSPGAASKDCEGLIQVWKISQDTTDAAVIGTIDFSNQRLLGIVFYTGDPNADQSPDEFVSIFDNEVFNQDIYITYFDVRGVNDPMNYYIELEQMSLDLNENTVATLKDIRNVA